jgi:hypothetical protein
MNVAQSIAAASCLLAGLVAVAGFAYCLRTGSPITFLRAGMLRLNASGPVDGPVLGSVSPDVGREVLQQLLSIPLPPADREWWSPFEVLDPDLFVSYVWNDGLGNCSNRCLAFARWLQLRRIPFAIVTIGRDPLYRFGYAHALIEAPVSFDGRSPVRWAVLDPLAGGVLMDGAKPASYARMLANWPDIRLTVARSDAGHPDTELWLDGSQGPAFLGFSQGPEVTRYLRFAKVFASFFGNGKRIRHVCMFVAVILGMYPAVRVDRFQSRSVSRRLVVDARFARLAIWGVRVSAMSAIALGAMMAIG